MAVETTADRKLEQAREHVQEATQALMEVLNDDTWGSDDFTQEATKEHRKALGLLFDIKDLVGRPR